MSAKNRQRVLQLAHQMADAEDPEAVFREANRIALEDPDAEGVMESVAMAWYARFGDRPLPVPSES